MSATVRDLRAEDRPTAAITYGAAETRPILMAAVMMGLRVPEDLSLITFTENVMSDMGWKLTTMVIPEFEVGRSATAMLLERIEAPALPSPPLPVALRFEPGETSRPPP